MADGTADEDGKGAKGPADAASPSATDWTVSDRRGPLSSAPATTEVERVVPGSEIDAEGAIDVVPPAAAESSAETGASSVDPAIVATASGGGASASNGPSPAPSPAAPAKSGSSKGSGIIAAIVGALIGAGSAAGVYAYLPRGNGDGVAALSARVDALDKRPDPQASIAALKGRVDDLSARVATLETRRPAGTAATPSAAPSAAVPSAAVPSAAAPSTAPGTASAAAPSAGTPSTGTTSASQPATSQPASASPTVATAPPAAPAVDLAPLVANITALQTKVDALQGSVGGAQRKADAAQSGVESVRSEQKALAGKLGAPALAVVADSLVEQIIHGRPFPTQVDALAALGADPTKVAILRQYAAAGVPSAQTLLAKFQPLANVVIAAGTKAPANADFGERLKYGLSGLVSVRRTDEVTGTDVASRVALIEADLAHDDVPGAYAAWSALPAAAKAKADAWGALAKTSVEALGVARGLQAESIGSLAQKRP